MKTITMTSKGQVTIPAEAQRSIGLKAGDKFITSFDPATGVITLRKAMTVDEVAAKAHAMRKKKVKPLVNIHEFYEIERTKEIMQKMRDNS